MRFTLSCALAAVAAALAACGGGSNGSVPEMPAAGAQVVTPSFRVAALTLALLAVGCANTPVNMAQVAVAVVAPSGPCGAPMRELPVLLTVRNGSAGRLQLFVSAEKGPPFNVSWLSYRVLSGSGDLARTDAVHGPGGHGPLAQPEIFLGPGDSTALVAMLHSVQAGDYETEFSIELKDTSGAGVMSPAFRLCQNPPSR